MLHVAAWSKSAKNPSGRLKVEVVDVAPFVVDVLFLGRLFLRDPGPGMTVRNGERCLSRFLEVKSTKEVSNQGSTRPSLAECGDALATLPDIPMHEFERGSMIGNELGYLISVH